MQLRILTTLLVLMTLPGAPMAQVIEDSILVEGYYRSFCFNKPRHSTGGDALVFVIHGSGGAARQYMKQTARIDEKMERDNFLLVFPQGYRRYWNECRKASTAEANRININEEAFFVAMIDYFVKNYGVDRTKVFVSGASGGGQMAYKMGMRIPEKLRGIAALIANLPTKENMDCVAAGKALPVLIINGTADPVNPDKGGEMKAGFSLGTVVSTDDSFAYWAGLAGYKGLPQKESLPDPVPGNEITMERYSHKKKGHPEVTLIKVINGVHGQPADMDFYTEVWRFFRRQLEQPSDK